MADGMDVFGMNVINADCKAVGAVLKKAVAAKSAFLLGVAQTMADIKLAQELGGLAYVARNGTGPKADPKGNAELDAAADADVKADAGADAEPGL